MFNQVEIHRQSSIDKQSSIFPAFKSKRCKKVQLFLIFQLNHVFSGRFGRIFVPIFTQFVNLINHNTIQ